MILDDPRVWGSAARWSTLGAEGWSPAEKVAHFLDALTILEDNLHCIDRLAVALTEAERAATAGGDQGAAMARSRSRAMLLHYAVLRGMLTHPRSRCAASARAFVKSVTHCANAAVGRADCAPTAAAARAEPRPQRPSLLGAVNLPVARRPTPPRQHRQDAAG